MPYRPRLAQKIHESLLSYLKKPCEKSLEEFKLALKNSNKRAIKRAIMKKSINGDSHLIDIFHLPAEFCPPGTSDTAKIIATLFSLLMNACVESRRTKKFLLLSSNQNGFTPLHQVLKSGHPENVKAYLAEVKQAFQDKVVSPQEYGKLLLQPNRDGFTPLHQAANSGSLDVLQFFITELEAFWGQQALYRCLYQEAKGLLPSCQVSANKPDAADINGYLHQKRKALDPEARRYAAKTVQLHPTESERQAKRGGGAGYSSAYSPRFYEASSPPPLMIPQNHLGMAISK